jgi:hypothetical protein
LPGTAFSCHKRNNWIGRFAATKRIHDCN